MQVFTHVNGKLRDLISKHLTIYGFWYFLGHSLPHVFFIGKLFFLMQYAPAYNFCWSWDWDMIFRQTWGAYWNLKTPLLIRQTGQNCQHKRKTLAQSVGLTVSLLLAKITHGFVWPSAGYAQYFIYFEKPGTRKTTVAISLIYRVCHRQSC